MVNCMQNRLRLLRRCLLVLGVALCLLASSSDALVNAATLGRVVGGSNAPSTPFIVSMQYNGQHYCAGSILNTNWVLTAAHCLASKTQVLSSTLVGGSTNVAGTGTTTQKRSITYYVVNSLYNGGTTPYDIGMVYTPTAWQWTSAVAAITLPQINVVPTGNAVLYGWGSVSTTSVASYPSLLQMATVPIIPLSTCESALGAQGDNVHQTNLCTGPLTGGVGICVSDSGGPLTQTVSGKPVLIGIVSWGQMPCGQKNSPSVYVQVSSFITWINTNQNVPK